MGRWLLLVWLCACAPKPEPGPLLSGQNLKFECPVHSVTAFSESRSLLVGPELACVAHVADRVGAPIVGLELNLLSEAGRLRGSLSDAEGAITVTHEVSQPTPLDVAPELFPDTPPFDAVHTGQPLAPPWMRPQDWVEEPWKVAFSQTGVLRREPRRPDPIRTGPSGRPQNNPRDNLVTLVAYARGAEAFTDLQENGTWDGQGEPYEDLTEPFVDANDNGTWDPNEPFADANGNGQWDGKNGTWDADTLVWVQERVLWTGVPAFEDWQFVVPGVVGQQPTFARGVTTVHLVCPTTPCASATPATVNFYLADPWFSLMTGSRCAALPQSGAPLVTFEVTTNVDGSAEVPAGLVGTITVKDVRNPATPATNRPIASPPLQFWGSIECSLSDGSATGRLFINVADVDGTIQ